MWHGAYLAFGLLVCLAYGWATWSGYELGDDAATSWSQQGINHYHK